MLKKILATISVRYVVAALNLALIFVNAKVLGAGGVGLVGILLASMNLAVMFNSLFCGSTIVYFMSRYPIRQLMVPAYLWAFAGSALASGAMWAFGLFPAAYWADICGLALLNSLAAANSRFLLGLDRIKAFNLVFFLQSGLLFFILLFYYYVAEEKAVSAYLKGMYWANGSAVAASFFLLAPSVLPERGCAVSPPSGRNQRFFDCQLLRSMLAYGIWSNIDNLAETLSTRLNYFFVQHFAGLGSVGLLDGGTKISESVWHISRSVGYIAYGEIARSGRLAEQKQITLRLFRLTLVATLAVMGVILLIPEWFFTDYLFSPEFAGITTVIRCLAAGIVALACNTIFSQFFIGSGRVKYSAFGSCLGLLVLGVAGSWLVPLYGVAGGAAATSIAFCATLAFSAVCFLRIR